ncbi:GNAT family N-acetyltransferase [Paenibacillus filicis]|uniref:GNAT family N-acetyltransferase n=1 Tax=Paenibacillus gyeongsangnamensis TaxID=3388067 RepID=A0ABT4Q7M6_9BACL|nr:GNAT family N-acetyltransferase [Paenibacillus filicis]MCZ8512797.1 GNAT family N-acetyltransferase [Paenibacillus filicis]
MLSERESIIWIAEGDIGIRRMEYSPNDISLLEKWLNDEVVQDYYEGRSKTYTREQIVAKFGPRLLGNDPVIPCLILYHGVAIGYIQYYQLLSQEQEDYSVDPGKLAYGIDLFIGEPSYWNKRIGSKALKRLLAYLFEEIRADIVCVDPQTWNERAIRCYLKCGFKKTKVLEQREHLQWIL